MGSLRMGLTLPEFQSKAGGKKKAVERPLAAGKIRPRPRLEEGEGEREGGYIHSIWVGGRRGE